MKVNFSKKTIEAIAEFQNNPVLGEAIEDVENFIIEYIDPEIDDEEIAVTMSKKALCYLKFLRKLRGLIKIICEQDEQD